MKRSQIVTLLLAAGLSIPAVGSAQQAAAVETVDGIAAIVGNEIILRSEVQLQGILLAQSNGLDFTRLSESERLKLQEEGLNQLIDQKLIIARARRDSVVVARSEIEAAITNQIDLIKQNLGGEQAFQSALQNEGLTLSDLRSRFFPDAEANLLQSRLLQKYQLGRPSPVSRRDARAFLNEGADQFLVLRRILLRGRSGADPFDAALGRITALRRRIVEGGEDFADVAREHSDDGTAPEGGDLGERTRNHFVPEFDQAVWSLPVGTISDPIRTEFGWHLIEVLERSEETVHARHIVIVPRQTGAMTAALADSIQGIQEELARGVPFARIAERYDPVRRGYVGLFLPPLGDPGLAGINSAIPPEWIEPLQSLQPGEWTAALEDTAGVHIIRRMPIDDTSIDLVLQHDFVKIEQLVQRQHQKQEILDWLRELREETYIEIKKRR